MQLGLGKKIQGTQMFLTKVFVEVSNKCFLMQIKSVKEKLLLNKKGIITKGIIRSSKLKQNTYVKYLKCKTTKNNDKYVIVLNKLKEKSKYSIFFKPN